MNKMKNSFLFVISVLVIFISSVSAQKSGKSFSGTVFYTINYDGTWDAATLAQQPRETSVVLNDVKSKSVFLAGGASISIITNTIDSSVTTLINAMGMKMYVKQTKDNILESLDEVTTPKINYLDETKTIAGYECKKAEYITLDEYDDEVTTIVFYTTAIGKPGMNWGGSFHGLNGFPMEYTIDTTEGKITFTATEVKQKKIKDIEFLIPTDYEEMSPEQFKSLGG
jgi:GLPGLI family protein